ncbi:hypothetical protein EDB87DRAFT_1577778 [Lactarius vividus]|nr:hypothetical protein EDB87DRAFT_1577778 [Lactarius vividus]
MFGTTLEKCPSSLGTCEARGVSAANTPEGLVKTEPHPHFTTSLFAPPLALPVVLVDLPPGVQATTGDTECGRYSMAGLDSWGFLSQFSQLPSRCLSLHHEFERFTPGIHFKMTISSASEHFPSPQRAGPAQRRALPINWLASFVPQQYINLRAQLSDLVSGALRTSVLLSLLFLDKLMCCWLFFHDMYGVTRERQLRALRTMPPRARERTLWPRNDDAPFDAS